MLNRNYKTILILLTVGLAGTFLWADELPTQISVPEVGESGAITFKMQTNQTFRNGQDRENYRQPLIRLPGIFEISFARSNQSVNLRWAWDDRSGRGTFNDIILGMTDLPGPETCLLKYTRDSERGISGAYLNGTPLRVPGAKFPTWWIGKEATTLEIHGGRLTVSDVRVNSHYTPPEGIRAAVPEAFFGRHANLTGFPEPPNPLELETMWHYGPAIIFFAAQGERGEDIFDPSLPERDGRFVHYRSRTMTSCHISYFGNVESFQMGRVDSNLRKNNRFYRVGGVPVAILPGTRGWQQMRLIKKGNRIQLFANGGICVDWTDDDPDRYGPPHGGGRVDLRQMKPTVGQHRNVDA